MPTPRPGERVRGSRTGRPIMALLDLLGRRWVLRIVWELRGDALGFRALQARCGGMSPSVLAERLRDLENTGIAEQDERADYRLTGGGKELIAALLPIHAWAEAWARRASFRSADCSSPRKH